MRRGKKVNLPFIVPPEVGPDKGGPRSGGFFAFMRTKARKRRAARGMRSSCLDQRVSDASGSASSRGP